MKPSKIIQQKAAVIFGEGPRDPNERVIRAILDYLDSEYEAKQKAEPRWRGCLEDEYYFIGVPFQGDQKMGVMDDTEDETRVDDERYEEGNYYKTKTEAEEALARVKMALKGG